MPSAGLLRGSGQPIRAGRAGRKRGADPCVPIPRSGGHRYTRFAALRRGKKAGKWLENLEKHVSAACAHNLVLAYGMG